jgi:hypothetical protein
MSGLQSNKLPDGKGNHKDANPRHSMPARIPSTGVKKPTRMQPPVEINTTATTTDAEAGAYHGKQRIP